MECWRGGVAGESGLTSASMKHPGVCTGGERRVLRDYAVDESERRIGRILGLAGVSGVVPGGCAKKKLGGGDGCLGGTGVCVGSPKVASALPRVSGQTGTIRLTSREPAAQRPMLPHQAHDQHLPPPCPKKNDQSSLPFPQPPDDMSMRANHVPVKVLGLVELISSPHGWRGRHPAIRRFRRGGT